MIANPCACRWLADLARKARESPCIPRPSVSGGCASAAHSIRDTMLYLRRSTVHLPALRPVRPPLMLDLPCNEPTLRGTGGDACALLRERDWATTQLGPRESWPAALRAAVDVAMGSRMPMIVLWGPE